MKRRAVKKTLLIATAAVAAAGLLSACADGYYGGPGPGPGVEVAEYDGYYDGAYGAIYDGYWGGDAFYYRNGEGGHWRRDTGHHFRRDAAPGYNHVHGQVHRAPARKH